MDRIIKSYIDDFKFKRELPMKIVDFKLLKAKVSK